MKDMLDEELNDDPESKLLNPVYCRQLEDKSGFGVFEGTAKENLAALPGRGGRGKWEKCVGVGNTEEEAWQDYRTRSVAGTEGGYD